MLMLRSDFLRSVGVVLLAGVAGCGGPDKNSVEDVQPQSVPPAKSATTGEPKVKGGRRDPQSLAGEVDPKKVPLPELPAGAGEIDADAPEVFRKLPSGLKYRILRNSDGRQPRLTDRWENVTAHYKGWLDNGEQFDSSYDRGAPIMFYLTRALAGWQEGLQLIGEGGVIELEIPPSLVSGSGFGLNAIPHGATLHYIVELVKVQ